MLSFECIKNEKSVYFLLTSAKTCFLWNFRMSALPDWAKNNFYFLSAHKIENDY